MAPERLLVIPAERVDVIAPVPSEGSPIALVVGDAGPRRPIVGGQAVTPERSSGRQGASAEGVQVVATRKGQSPSHLDVRQGVGKGLPSGRTEGRRRQGRR